MAIYDSSIHHCWFQAKYLTKNTTASSVDAVKSLDDILVQLTVSTRYMYFKLLEFIRVHQLVFVGERPLMNWERAKQIMKKNLKAFLQEKN